MSIKAKTTDKGKLVKACAIRKPMELYTIAPGRDENGSGVYILYKNKKVYYVGLSKISIRGRLRRHTRDKHKGKWNYFSFYHIPRRKYVKDLESILLGTYRPYGNVLGGKLKKVVIHME